MGTMLSEGFYDGELTYFSPSSIERVQGALHDMQ